MRTTFVYKLKNILKNFHVNNLYRIRIQQKNLLKKIIKEHKATKRKIRVCFLVLNCEKWNADSLFQKMKQSNYFEPFIVLTAKDLAYMKNEAEINLHYDFYKERYGENFSSAYNLKNDEYADLRKYKPDIIFYQEGWFLNTTIHYVKNICEFALPCYFPYPIAEPVTVLKQMKNIFHVFLWKHYIAHPLLKKEYKKAKLNLPNLNSTGHPKLDVYHHQYPRKGKEYILYAPHHSLDDSVLKWGTFKWSGKFMLDYAKAHPEINWIYKPHPQLIHTIARNKIMTKEEYNDYVNEWRKIGLVYLEGDYFDLFRESKCLITCCGSFLIEYFPTMNPVIHLRTPNTSSTSSLNHAVMETYYKAYNEIELTTHLADVLANNDYMRPEREKLYKKIELFNQNAADNIIKDLQKEFKLK